MALPSHAPSLYSVLFNLFFLSINLHTFQTHLLRTSNSESTRSPSPLSHKPLPPHSPSLFLMSHQRSSHHHVMAIAEFVMSTRQAFCDPRIYPRRIRAYPNKVLHLIYPPSIDLPGLRTPRELEKSIFYDDDNWEDDFFLAANDSFETDSVQEEHTMPTDLSTHTAASAPDTNLNQHPLVSISSPHISEAIQVF
ncbi:MAG: hypothetical protein J3R72DRAFT_511116 [Linnemannia gamsii]|nr:MAG: hypothetical protein J3R72DRAFT_511116 [Linnemannia gamsii]